MTDDNQLPEDNIRRVGKKDRKKQLEDAGPLFPEEEHSDPLEELSPDQFDVEADKIAEADQEQFTPEQQRIAQELEEGIRQPIIPIIYTPSEERFPPLSPSIQPELAQEAEIDSEDTGRRSRLQGDWRHDLIAVSFALATIILFAYYAIIWRDPYSPLNPFAPTAPFVYVTWTPDYSSIVNSYGTQTSEAIIPLLSVPTPLAVTPSDLSPTLLIPVLPFRLVDSGIMYLPNSNGLGCNWASIGGVVTGLNGEFLDGYIIQIIDHEDPAQLNVQVASGHSPTFGDGGFEFHLGGAPREKQYRVQLLSQEGVPLSEEYLVLTYDDCQQNVAIVNFQQMSRF